MAQARTKMVGLRLANKLAKIAQQQVDTSMRFKQQRMEEVKMNEEMYNLKSLPRLRGRYSVPLPTMSGYVDTLLSKIDEAPTIEYSSEDKADKKDLDVANKIARKELKRRELRWLSKDRNQKKMAIFSGVGIGEFFSESDPKYKNFFNVIDHYDFHCEPLAGPYVEVHDFCGRMNLFKTEFDLKSLGEDGYYDAGQVQKLLNSTSEKDRKRNEETFQNKISRYQILGMDPDTYDYAGQAVYPLVWWGITYEGERYLITFDYKTGIWVRCVKLSDVTESGLWPWAAWHTNPDEFVFWSKGPADDIRPVAVAIDIIFNQALDNRQKRNYGMRAFDPDIFPDPEELEWRPDGIVRANTGLGLKQIGQGIYEFQTPEVTGSIDMITFMENYLSAKTGIQDASEGESDEKVGIYFGELQKVADRLGLYNKSYSEFHADLGLRLLWGMKEHLNVEDAKRILGIMGAEIDEIRIDPEWGINVTGGQAEFRANEVKKQKRAEALDKIFVNESLASRVNPDWAIEQILRNAEYEDEDIEKALDTADSASADLIAEAERAIEDILAGKEPRLNRQATTAFIKHIVDFATNTVFSKDPQKDMEMYGKLSDYAQAHLEIAAMNAQRKAGEVQNQRAAQGSMPVPPEQGGGMVMEGAEYGVADMPPPNTPQGTQAAVSDIQDAVTP